MVSNTCTVITVTTKVWLRSLLLLDLNSDNLDLVVAEANLNFKLIGHDELVSFN
jgi:hypothetical protein